MKNSNIKAGRVYIIKTNATIVVFENYQDKSSPYVLDGEITPLEQRGGFRHGYYVGHSIIAEKVLAVTIKDTDHEGIGSEQCLWGDAAENYISKENAALAEKTTRENSVVRVEKVEEDVYTANGKLYYDGEYKTPEGKEYYNFKLSQAKFCEAMDSYEKVEVIYGERIFKALNK